MWARTRFAASASRSGIDRERSSRSDSGSSVAIATWSKRPVCRTRADSRTASMRCVEVVIEASTVGSCGSVRNVSTAIAPGTCPRTSPDAAVTRSVICRISVVKSSTARANVTPCAPTTTSWRLCRCDGLTERPEYTFASTKKSSKTRIGGGVPSHAPASKTHGDSPGRRMTTLGSPDPPSRFLS